MSRSALVALAPLAPFPVVAGAARSALLVALRFRLLALRVAPLALLSQLVLRPRGPISPAWSFANSAAQGRHSSQPNAHRFTACLSASGSLSLHGVQGFWLSAKDQQAQRRGSH